MSEKLSRRLCLKATGTSLLQGEVTDETGSSHGKAVSDGAALSTGDNDGRVGGSWAGSRRRGRLVLVLLVLSWGRAGGRSRVVVSGLAVVDLQKRLQVSISKSRDSENGLQ